MPPVSSTLRQLAMLGSHPAFPPGHPLPLIYPAGYRPKGDFSAVDAILANQENDDSATRPSQQRFVAKNLPGVGNPGPSYRVTLQNRIGEFLGIDPITTSVICVSSSTTTLRALLKGVRATDGADGRNEVIVPQTTVGATVEAVIDEGFLPVFVSVDPATWLLSPEATERSISEKMAAIITFDWLGTQCNLGPFWKLADKHDIKLISDSTQSFGASNGKPSSITLADATIYSLGYPKVLTGAGSGGLIVCPEGLERLLKSEPSGILRHEALDEINAYMTLRAFSLFPNALKARGAAGDLYCQHLAGLPGITFQQVPAGLATNHYQVSFTVDAKVFRLSAKGLCMALRAENVHCSADRMPCVAANDKFARQGRVEGVLKHSQLLATTSVTLPIANNISLDTVKTICDLVKLIHKMAPEVVKAQKKTAASALTAPSETADVVDLESKFRQHLIMPILDDASVHSKQWSLGECVLEELRVDAIIGKVVILGPESAGQLNPVALDESSPSASVELVPGADGTLTVHKSAFGQGIDGNGAPWLRRQSLFLGASSAVKKTGMFVEPTKIDDDGSHVTLLLPYIQSHSFGELVFANVGAEPLVDAMVKMLARMAKGVWTKGQEPAESDFIQKAHFDRMRRRVQIACNQDKMLDKILKKKTVMLNSKRLDGFERVMKKLESHPAMAKIVPKLLSEIHGDLNVHNVLTRLDPKDGDDPEALIDPRGVPLLGDDEEKVFECGNYCYDVSKLLFSLTSFSDIRKQLFKYSVDGNSHKLELKQHPGSDTMSGAANTLILALAANDTMRQWIKEVEQDGLQSFELRVRVGEVAHFVADCACALGWDTPWEIVPLFLMGLKKLNDVIDLLEGDAQLATENPEPTSDYASVPASADFGAVMIQHNLFQLLVSPDNWPYDVLELSVKIESAPTLKALLRDMVGTYLPKGTKVYLSTDPIEPVDCFIPCVLIHPSNGVKGQTHMLAVATCRTTAFFWDNRLSQDAVDNLRIVHISSTGSSSHSQFTARDNDKLLSPGSFGISPLTLALLQLTQIPFPKPGRWVVENDSFFLLSQPLKMGGDELCLLAIERPTSGSSSSWRVCIDEVEDSDGLLLAKSFRNIEEHEKGKNLIRTTTGLFLLHHLAKEICSRENDYARRTSPLLIDVVLPRFMGRKEWIALSHRQGYGAGSDQVWSNAQSFQVSSKAVELANGREEMDPYHYGSDSEYQKLLAAVRGDARLNSLAYIGAVAHWLHRNQASGSLGQGSAMTD
ncbi:hypothetical protein FRB93_004172 [Tulasnella sp. JGI-2019a]|nr:hypothetical protein FRB93_004172 [Tulasnella sp. JGI-2019a]